MERTSIACYYFQGSQQKVRPRQQLGSWDLSLWVSLVNHLRNWSLRKPIKAFYILFHEPEWKWFYEGVQMEKRKCCLQKLYIKVSLYHRGTTQSYWDISTGLWLDGLASCLGWAKHTVGMSGRVVEEWPWCCGPSSSPSSLVLFPCSTSWNHEWSS